MIASVLCATATAACHNDRHDGLREAGNPVHRDSAEVSIVENPGFRWTEVGGAWRIDGVPVVTIGGGKSPAEKLTA
jgi:hypothetical protein